MKINRTNRHRSGFVTLLVIVVAGLMATYLMLNTTTVTHLSRSLRVIEKKQLLKFNTPPKPKTGSPAALRAQNKQ